MPEDRLASRPPDSPELRRGPALVLRPGRSGRDLHRRQDARYVQDPSKTRRFALRDQDSTGKTIVSGAKDRGTKEVAVSIVSDTSRASLRSFVRKQVEPGAVLYTADHAAHKGIPDFRHESVRHSVGEYVRGQAHTNGIESFWSMLKRGHIGTYHCMSRKHLGRYVSEFAGRHNPRDTDTADQLEAMARGLLGKRLPYADLTA